MNYTCTHPYILLRSGEPYRYSPDPMLYSPDPMLHHYGHAALIISSPHTKTTSSAPNLPLQKGLQRPASNRWAYFLKRHQPTSALEKLPGRLWSEVPYYWTMLNGSGGEARFRAIRASIGHPAAGRGVLVHLAWAVQYSAVWGNVGCYETFKDVLGRAKAWYCIKHEVPSVLHQK